MKRLALLLAAVAACVLFTACPDNKPTDEPVVIPDGTYEETAHLTIYTWSHDYSAMRDTLRLWIDTVQSAIVDVKDGLFMYRGMCQDTIHKWALYEPYLVIYSSPFIYADDSYCEECKVSRYPAKATKDGFVLFEEPAFAKLTPLYKGASKKFRVYQNGDTYQFEQRHDSIDRATVISKNTLTPLSNQ